MEEKLAYSKTEQDIVLLHHEVVVDYPDDRAETHRSTLLAMGRTENGKTTMAMALTVGIPAATGALLLLANKITANGELRPMIQKSMSQHRIFWKHMVSSCWRRLNNQ